MQGLDLSVAMPVVQCVRSDLALFDSEPLVRTLGRVIDFDCLNAAAVPLIIGTVDMQNGEPVYIDTRREKLEPLHFWATTAFTPGFPPV